MADNYETMNQESPNYGCFKEAVCIDASRVYDPAEIRIVLRIYAYIFRPRPRLSSTRPLRCVCVM